MKNTTENDVVKLTEDVSGSPLYSEDLAPVPLERRSWNTWSLAALWVGMAVCIPTYILASYMIRAGLNWYMSLIIIALANVIITVPMVLNGHAGVKFGIPFPVFGRAAFGTNGIHIPSMLRAIVACGWFGVQTWIGGLAFYEIWCAVSGNVSNTELSGVKFACFGLFWLVNVYFIWKGTESIKWLEIFSAPILIVMGLVLIGWGVSQADSFGAVLDQSKQLENPTAVLRGNDAAKSLSLSINPLKRKDGKGYRVEEYQIAMKDSAGNYSAWPWSRIQERENVVTILKNGNNNIDGLLAGSEPVKLVFRTQVEGKWVQSSAIEVMRSDSKGKGPGDTIWTWVIWLTTMVGFWATMSLSISDITRYAKTQREQVAGQFIGLPGTMVLYSFVGIFVTCAAVANFSDILIAEDAPWDPVTLLGKFKNPWVVVFSQIMMLIATLSTNIAANVIAPANIFANIFPKKVSFKMGGMITAFIGIVICPWWLLDSISNILLLISGLLGPVLGILLADYFFVRKMNLNLAGLYKTDGEYSYNKSGINPAAMIALGVGIALAIVGLVVPQLDFLYKLSWFTGFGVSFGLYLILMKERQIGK